MALNAKDIARLLEELWEEAREFNRSLNIPVLWKPAPKRSGNIKKKVWTDGYSGPEHVLLLEDMESGRLKRRRGEFLCGASVGNRKLHEVFNLSDTDPGWSMRIPVRCPKCLEIAERWK